jgi:Zn-dependent peptidase ImmA (M78 family)
MRSGTPGFIPERLVQAREARAIGTQVGLANLIGKPQASVSRWESGEATPEPEALDIIAERLNVRRSFFLRPVPAHGTGGFFFRARRNVERPLQARERARVRWVQDISLALQHYFDFPKFDVPDLLGGQSYLLLRADDLERIASDLRRHWQMEDGPVTSMIALLETKGFVVARDIAGSARLDGLFCWSEVDQRPYVLLAKDKQSFFRSQMDAAHEMAHAILHRRLSQEEFERNFKLIEEQAFRLASAFLMPSTTFAIEAKHKTLSGFITLKERWRVSVKAMIKRCSDLDLLDEEESTQLYKYYSARGWNKGEPMDDRFTGDQPRLLAKAITTLVEERTRTKDDLLGNEFAISPADVEELCALDQNWFHVRTADIIQLEQRSHAPHEGGKVIRFPVTR